MKEFALVLLSIIVIEFLVNHTNIIKLLNKILIKCFGLSYYLLIILTVMVIIYMIYQIILLIHSKITKKTKYYYNF
jgi:hypothetical protein